MALAVLDWCAEDVGVVTPGGMVPGGGVTDVRGGTEKIAEVDEVEEMVGPTDTDGRFSLERSFEKTIRPATPALSTTSKMTRLRDMIVIQINKCAPLCTISMAIFSSCRDRTVRKPNRVTGTFTCLKSALALILRHLWGEMAEWPKAAVC